MKRVMPLKFDSEIPEVTRRSTFVGPFYRDSNDSSNYFPMPEDDDFLVPPRWLRVVGWFFFAFAALYLAQGIAEFFGFLRLRY